MKRPQQLCLPPVPGDAVGRGRPTQGLAQVKPPRPPLPAAPLPFSPPLLAPLSSALPLRTASLHPTGQEVLGQVSRPPGLPATRCPVKVVGVTGWSSIWLKGVWRPLSLSCPGRPNPARGSHEGCDETGFPLAPANRRFNPRVPCPPSGKPVHRPELGPTGRTAHLARGHPQEGQAPPPLAGDTGSQAWGFHAWGCRVFSRIHTTTWNLFTHSARPKFQLMRSHETD